MKIRAKNQDGRLMVSVILPLICKIKEEEIDVIKKNSIRGILRLEHHNRIMLNYTGPTGIPLKEYLKRSLSKYNYFSVIAQILELVKKIDFLNLKYENVIKDINHIYINEITNELQFIYLPVADAKDSMDIRKFIEMLSFEAEFEDEDIDYVAEFVNYVNALKTPDIEAIEQYISGEDELIARRIVRNNTSGRYITKSIKTVKNNEGETPTELLQPCEDNEQKGAEVADSADKSDEKFAEEELEPYLLRINTNEKIYIEKSVFRIGKEASCVDYYLEDEAVSRLHADIIIRKSGVYIFDNGSKNHTYVNGKVIPPRKEFAIQDCDVIKVARVEFELHL